MTNEEKPNNTDDEILQSWPTSSREDAKRLAAYMTSHPSDVWLGMMQRAEAHTIEHWDLLLEYSDSIYESIAEYTANLDGNVIIDEN